MHNLSNGGYKVKRTFSVVFIILIIALICVVEELVVKEVSTAFTKQSKGLYEQLQANETNINTLETNQKYDALSTLWEEEKHKLCYLTNYDKIKNVDESMSRLKYAIASNDYPLAIDNISIVISFSDFLRYFMGFNINNLF